MKKMIIRACSTISPVVATKLLYFFNFGKVLHLNNPQTINEKIQYLKLNAYYNNPVVTQCIDKWRVRNYLEEKGCASLLPKLYHGGITDPEDIKQYWDTLPEQFVVKCNHGSGYNILVKDKATRNVDEIVSMLRKWMKEDYWKRYSETQYRFIEKAILVEEYLGSDILTYKFYCFNGEPKVLYALLDPQEIDYPDGTKAENHCMIAGKELTILSSEESYVKEVSECRETLEEMLAIARQLSADFPFVRVDLYDINGRIYFSELTFIPTGGLMKINPPEVMDEWSRALKC